MAQWRANPAQTPWCSGQCLSADSAFLFRLSPNLCPRTERNDATLSMFRVPPDSQGQCAERNAWFSWDSFRFPASGKVRIPSRRKLHRCL